jgi:hypothetical protein
VKFSVIVAFLLFAVPAFPQTDSGTDVGYPVYEVGGDGTAPKVCGQSALPLSVQR